MKIGLRVLLGYFLIVALAALLIGKVFVQQVKPGVRQAMEDTLADTANTLAELASDDLLAGQINSGRFAQRLRALSQRDPDADVSGFRKHSVSYRIYITDTRGIVVFDSTDQAVGADYSRWNDVYLTLQGRYGARSTRSVPDDDSTSVMHVAAPIYAHESASNRIIGVLTVAKPNLAMAPFIEHSRRIILNWGLVLLGSALAIGLIAAWWLARQLGRLRHYAQGVTAGERTPLPATAGEFAELGLALETMRERLDGKQYIERYVHALTHELKSPLAAIRAAAELLEQPMAPADHARFVSNINEQGQRLAQMIDKMLALAAAEHRQRIERPEPVEVTALLHDLAAALRERLDIRRVRLLLPTDVATVPGDAFLLRQALSNLLDNALDFAPADSTVEVTLTQHLNQLHISVADRGPGIPDYALLRVFERFYSLPRPDGGSRSSGLGLCLVAEVAALHSGTAMLINREGGGAVAVMTLSIN